MTKSSRPSKAPKEAKAPTGAKPGGKANVNEVAVNEGRWEDDEHERGGGTAKNRHCAMMARP